MSYDFVQAKWYSKGARAEVRALVVHMAEGGNTVHYFQTVTRDVSSTFVIEYSGRVVQMVHDGDVDHCQHVSPGSWSYPGGLSPKVGRTVLGDSIMDNPDRTRVNRYVQSIEIEGFRKDGPNAAQKLALESLVAERRAKFPELRGLLGHGDVQDKACPGALIPWPGGHGLFTEEEPVQSFSFTPDTKLGTVVVNGTGHYYQLLRDGSMHGPINPDNFGSHRAIGPVKLLTPIPGGSGTDRTTAYIIEVTDKAEAAALLAFSVTFTPLADCADAVAAEHERTRAAAIAAVEAIA